MCGHMKCLKNEIPWQWDIVRQFFMFTKENFPEIGVNSLERR